MLVYKEAARDQAQRPAGNPPGGEGANSCPGKYPGEYKLTTMKSLIYNILQTIFKGQQGAKQVYIYSYAYNCNMYMCCCC